MAEENNSQIIRLSDPQQVSMTPDWYDFATKDHFWMKWRFRIFAAKQALLPAPGSKVLDIGCGIGVFLEQLAQRFDYKLHGCDLNEPALLNFRCRQAQCFLYDITKPDPAMKEQFDLVTLLDVIEHVDNDVDFIRRSADHLKVNGTMVINVPAIPALWSLYDEEAGHKRRYMAETLRSVIAEAGLRPVSVIYWGAALVPLLLARIIYSRCIDRASIIRQGFEPPVRFLNSIFDFAGMIGSKASFASPIGSSVMAFAVKDQNPN